MRTKFPVCNILPALIYINSEMYETGLKAFLKENLCVLQVFLCVLISRPVCAHTRTA